MEIFVGSKEKPTFLVEINKNKKQVAVYTPDKFSKNEEFYEKYSLGKKILDEKYDSIVFLDKPIPYIMRSVLLPQLIINVKGKYFILTNKMTTLKSL
jgi:hypothetical protein